MAFTTDLLTGLAQLLALDGVAVWQPAGAYADDEVGIVLGVPTQSPASLIAIAAYNAIDDPALSDSTAQVQFRFRGPDADPGPADDLADGVFNSLQGRHGAVLNGITLVYARRN